MKIIVANWKMNPETRKEAEKLFNKVKKTDAIFCVPSVYLPKLKSKNLCAQNCYWKNSGAYTGEISPEMLKDLGVKYVIVGHSERRIHFKETNAMVNKKLEAVLDAGLKPILCIGGKKDLEEISKNDFKRIIIAYEPIWAIGTGNFCKPEKAKEMLTFIKQKVDCRVLYGGSVNSKIAADYIKVGFDGLLVGGASLKPDEFIKIVKSI